MKEWAEVITAVAALLGAILWPAIILVLVLVFRKPVSALVAQLPGLAGRVEKVDAWGLHVTLRRLGEAAAGNENADKGRISSEQLQLAAEIRADVDQLGERTLLHELDRLCREYDSVRRTMSSGFERTRSMTAILAQMRALSPAISSRLTTYKSSNSAGSRLAAVAAMQMQVDQTDIDWLVDRFRKDQPFVFYHAALALQNVVDQATPSMRPRAISGSHEALNILESFDGEPDRETIEVLKSIVDA